MKWLYLIRHAHAEDIQPGQEDFDRTLSPAGKQEAKTMGQRLLARHCQADLILCSPAKRTHVTAIILATAITYPMVNIQTQREIYNAEMLTLLNIIHKLNPLIEKVMLIGHNPGISALATYLCKQTLDPLPTCGLYHLAFTATAWSECARNSQAQLLNFDSPDS